MLISSSGMEYAVRYQHEKFGGNLKPGDHILTNHPLAGGTHLPDITIVTPVWDGEGKNIIFYVASRGHHGKHEALPFTFTICPVVLTKISRNRRHRPGIHAFKQQNAV